MKKITLVLLLLLCLPGRVWAYSERGVHDPLVEIFKDIEAIFSWHVEDRKTLKEVFEESCRSILS